MHPSCCCFTDSVAFADEFIVISSPYLENVHCLYSLQAIRNATRCSLVSAPAHFRLPGLLVLAFKPSGVFAAAGLFGVAYERLLLKWQHH